MLLLWFLSVGLHHVVLGQVCVHRGAKLQHLLDNIRTVDERVSALCEDLEKTSARIEASQHWNAIEDALERVLLHPNISRNTTEVLWTLLNASIAREAQRREIADSDLQHQIEPLLAEYHKAEQDKSFCVPGQCGKGVCVDRKCQCPVGLYTGLQCEVPVCPSGCQNGGSCIAPGLCACRGPFGGTDCCTKLDGEVRLVTSFPNLLQPLNSSVPCQGVVELRSPFTLEYGTLCSSGMAMEEAHVICRSAGFQEGASTIIFDDRFFVAHKVPSYVIADGLHCTGDEMSIYNCSIPPRFVQHSCSSLHQAVSVVCKPCSIARQNAGLPCLHGGHSVGPALCSCPKGYEGHRCEHPICPTVCQNGGVCVAPGQCQCPAVYTGRDCTIEANVNISTADLAMNTSSFFFLTPRPDQRDGDLWRVCEGFPYRKMEGGALPVLKNDTSGWDSVCTSIFGAEHNDTRIEWIRQEVGGFVVGTFINGTQLRVEGTYIDVPVLLCGPCAIESPNISVTFPSMQTNLSSNCSLHGTWSSSSSMCECWKEWTGIECDLPVMSTVCPGEAIPVFPNVCVCPSGTTIESRNESECVANATSTHFYVRSLSKTVIFGVVETIDPFTKKRSVVLDFSDYDATSYCSTLSLQWVNLRKSFGGHLLRRPVNVSSYVSEANITGFADQRAFTGFIHVTEPLRAQAKQVLCMDMSLLDSSLNSRLCNDHGRLSVSSKGVMSCVCEGEYGGWFCATLLKGLYRRRVQIPTIHPRQERLEDQQGGLLHAYPLKSEDAVNVCLPSLYTYTRLGVSRVLGGRPQISTNASVGSTVWSYERIEGLPALETICRQQGLPLLSVRWIPSIDALRGTASETLISTTSFGCSANATSLSNCSQMFLPFVLSDVEALALQCGCPEGAYLSAAGPLFPRRIAKLTAGKRDHSEYLGFSGATLSANGLVLAAGAYKAFRHGAVYVWTRASKNQSFSSAVAEVLSTLFDDDFPNGHVGYGRVALSSSGLVMAVGGPKLWHGRPWMSGKVVVWTRTSLEEHFTDIQPTWLFAPDAVDTDHFSWGGVTLSSTGLLVAAASVYGSVYVWSRTSLMEPFSNDNIVKMLHATRRDDFLGNGGVTISRNGTLVAGAAHGDDHKGIDSGSVYVWMREDAQSLSYPVKLTAPDGQPGDQLGRGGALLSSNGLVLAAAAWGQDTMGSNSGAVYVWTRSSLEEPFSASQVTKVTARDGSADERMGAWGPPFLSIDGLALTIGAHANDDNGENAGMAYMWRRLDLSDDFSSDPLGLIAPDGKAGDYLGHGGTSMTADGSMLAIGAYGVDDSKLDMGAVYLFMW